MNNIIIFTKKVSSGEKRIKNENNVFRKNNEKIKDIYCQFLISSQYISYKIVSYYYMCYKCYESMNKKH